MISYQQFVSDTQRQVKEVDAQTLHSLLPDKPLIIDIREANELSEGVIAEAKCISRGVLEARLASLAPESAGDPLQWLSTQPIYLYCRSGARSALAARSLTDMGLSRVFSLKGGMLGWLALGYQVTPYTN